MQLSSKQEIWNEHLQNSSLTGVEEELQNDGNLVQFDVKKSAHKQNKCRFGMISVLACLIVILASVSIYITLYFSGIFKQPE